MRGSSPPSVRRLGRPTTDGVGRRQTVSARPLSPGRGRPGDGLQRVGVELGVAARLGVALQRQAAAGGVVRRPAITRSSAGNRVMTSQPSAVTTSCSSIRAADQPSDAGQNVSRANTMPSWITSGWSSETSRLKIGFSQIVSPTPWPNWSANAASSSGKPNSWAFGHTETTSAVVTPGPDHLDRGVEVVAAALVGVDERARRAADRERAVVAGAVAHVAVQDVEVGRVARAAARDR